MRKIVFLRFGPPIMIPEINQALRPHFAADQSAKAFPMPGGVMSVFSTESSLEQVADSVKALNMPIPFFVFEYRPEMSSLPKQIEDAVNDNTPAHDAPPNEEVAEPTVDEILEKITEHGIESLTEREREILNAGKSEG